MPEHDGHRKRLMQRARTEGLDSFQPHEILELMLFFTIPRADTNPVGHRLIDSFGDFARVLEADETDLKAVKGVGEKSAFFLSLFPALFRAYQTSKIGKETFIRSIGDACEYARAMLFGKPYEQVYVIWLNTQNRVIRSEMIAEGGVGGAPVYVSKVAASALKHRAVKAVMAHNHPGGDVRPSPKDLETTQTVLRALKVLEIDVVDHIIISDDKHFSFQADSLMGSREIGAAQAYAAEYTGVRQFSAVIAEKQHE